MTDLHTAVINGPVLHLDESGDVVASTRVEHTPAAEDFADLFRAGLLGVAVPRGVRDGLAGDATSARRSR